MYNLTSFDTKRNILHSILLSIIVFSLVSACASHKPIMLYETSALLTSNKAQRKDIVTLTMPIAIDVVYYNGSRKTYMPAYQANVSYELLPGPQVFGFRYQDLITDEEGNSESIKSRTLIIKFNAIPGQHYVIDFIPPKSIEKALALEKTLQLTISHNNKVISSSFPAPQSPNGDWFSADRFTPGINELFNDSDNKMAEKPNRNAPALVHLQYWWSKASEAEKEAFNTQNNFNK